jgi:hypothetical protein
MLHVFDPLLQFRLGEEVPNTLINTEAATAAQTAQQVIPFPSVK